MDRYQLADAVGFGIKVVAIVCAVGTLLWVAFK